MTVSVVTNMGASVRQRLLNHARITGKPFGEVLQYYAMERFLYRLSMSDHSDKFLLKGALLLTAWNAPVSRPTMDIDLLGRTDNGVDSIVELIREVAELAVADDGIKFDAASFSGAPIREDADYAGARTTFVGRIETARVHMQIDIGFGDVVTPGPERFVYPTILNFDAPVLSGYNRETVMAEKLQAIVELRMANTRMKDYFDLWLLSHQPQVEKQMLRRAIQRTFANRKMELDENPIGLSPAFGADPTKQVQWKAFLTRSSIWEAPANLAAVVEELREFFTPLLLPSAE